MWQSPFKQLPSNGQQVWIRVTSIYGELAVATYNSLLQQFTTDTTSVVIPAYQVSRWKAYP